MAKIIITVEDTGNGTVRVTPTPSCKEMARMRSAGQDLTPAHQYALELIKRALEIAHAADNETGSKKIIHPNEFDPLY